MTVELTCGVELTCEVELTCGVELTCEVELLESKHAVQESLEPGSSGPIT